jgi:hypothetical protein
VNNEFRIVNGELRILPGCAARSPAFPMKTQCTVVSTFLTPVQSSRQSEGAVSRNQPTFGRVITNDTGNLIERSTNCSRQRIGNRSPLSPAIAPAAELPSSN